MILCLETSADRCSVALFRDGQLVADRRTDEERAHSRKLARFVQEVLDEGNVSAAQLDAVAYSEGPGSYTGLRVGLSLAKGMCFALDIPLIGIPTSRLFFLEAVATVDADRYITLQDARRMEAYLSIFRKDGELQVLDEPTILDEVWKAEILSAGDRIILCGTGAEKLLPLFDGEKNVRIHPSQPDAVWMVRPAMEDFGQGNFRDLLLSEPKYVKAPNITRPRSNASKA